METKKKKEEFPLLSDLPKRKGRLKRWWANSFPRMLFKGRKEIMKL